MVTRRWTITPVQGIAQGTVATITPQAHSLRARDFDTVRITRAATRRKRARRF